MVASLRTSTRAKNAVRLGLVYGFNILDPDTNEVRKDYVGKSVQKLAARERQHRGPEFDTDPSEQPWSDLIVGKPFIIEQGWWTPKQLDEREQYHIRRLAPRYNDRHNRDNPQRIPREVARAQREERDRQSGVAPSRNTADRVRRPVVGAVVRRPDPTERRERLVYLLSAVWLVLSAPGWWGASRIGLAGWHAPLAGAVAAGLFMLMATFIVHEVHAWWWSRKGRRQRREFAFRLTVVVAAVLLGLFVWRIGPTLLAQLPVQAVPTPR